ncbi:alginate lyase family protein [Flavobacterium sp. NG2]|uniref:alginate lyase family protein n=1 Tax=Flavobacterium sp. NG2 TaxID=3097547 RepID=UPI002A82F451|nr:alginate lyase family protein [Flavobacterium sp. NG2]WPR70837.1 alginate lyase family protein [Flavobacterium sp. NG2]
MKKLILLFVLFFVSHTQAQLVLWNFKSLQEAKQGNAPSLKTIIRDADKVLNKKLITVTDKEMTPPSGDKNDYMSMGRYWWPDPSKADGLPYIRNDGVSNPEIEKLDRYPLGSFAKSIENLALAYYITDDEKYAKKAVENLQIWLINKETKMNPNMNFGQTIPGKHGGKGRGEGILDTYSFVEMLDGVELLRKSNHFTKADQQAVKEWFTTYLDWMLTAEVAAEEQNAKNNHGTAFDVQIVRFAMFVGKNDIAKKMIESFPKNRLFAQIEPNGAQPLELERTTAFGYSVFNLTHFLDMAKLATVFKINLLKATSDDGRGILKAIDFLVPYIGKPITDFPYKQIKEWEEVQQKLCWQLYRVDKMLGKPVYKKYYKDHLDTKKVNTDAVLY